MRKLTFVCALAAVPLALAGCGGGGDEGVPAQLVGTYTTTLEAGDIPENPAPELKNAAGEWELVIATSGAPDGGPALAINHPEEGNLEAPGLTVDGDQLLLEDEECAAGPDGSYAFYDNAYRWTLDGSTLTLATVENECSDHVAETILTSNTWTKKP